MRNYLFALSQNIETLSKTITNGNIESSNTIIQFNKKSLGAIVKEISISEEVFVNFFRDLAWAPLTALTYDIFADKNDSNFKTQMFTQTTLCFVVMIVMSTMYNIVNTCCINTNQKFTQNKLIKSIFIVLGAGLAIPGWDAMQSWGVSIGTNTLKLNTSQAGYFSGIFPGVAEGPTQALTMKLYATYNTGWKKICDEFIANPSQHVWSFIKHIVYFASFGAIPGNMWQVAYQAISDAEMNDTQSTWLEMLYLGLGVALTVCSFNIIFATADTYLNKGNYHIEFPYLASEERLEPQHPERNNDDSII